MTAALSFLTSRWGFAAIGALLLVLTYSAWSIQVAGLRGDIAEEQQKTRGVQKQFDGYKLQVEQTISDERAARLAEVNEALKQRDALQEEAGRLQTAAAQAERRRVQASNQLLEALRHAPQVDVSPLAGATQRYLDGVRAAQNARASDNPPAP